ncbi:MAG: hypothetical protein MUC57_12095 [Desulfobacterales bacterium]|jgi:hypothetical protein|nr:hypothetical protein [Desulfobacterales bacterium]
MSAKSVLTAVTLISIFAVGPPASARDEIRQERVQFKKGETTATIKGNIKGYETVDYLLGAKAGQHMNVSLATKHGATYFNILAPGENEVAMFNASVSQNQFEGALPASGDYKIRVYMMRSAARRSEAASYTLTVGITGSPKASDFGKAPASDAKVKGTPYHATGPLPCTMGNDKPVQCEFGVIRGKAGNAEVHITPPGGLKRVLIFMGDKVTTNPGEKIKAVKQGYDWVIEVNDYEHYTIPEAVVQGG